jgi:hypothetical protein
MDGVLTVQPREIALQNNPTIQETSNKRVCYGIYESLNEHSTRGHTLATQPSEAQLHGAHDEDQYMEVNNMEVIHENPIAPLSLTPNQPPPEHIRSQSDERASWKSSQLGKARRMHDRGQPVGGFVFIVELDGPHLKGVHCRPKTGKIAPLLRQIQQQQIQQRGRPGTFFNKILRIVELNPNEIGMIPIDQFFQTENVLVFQRTSHEGVDPMTLVDKIAQTVAFQVKVAANKRKAASQKAQKHHNYFLRSTKRQTGTDLVQSGGSPPRTAKPNHHLRVRKTRRKDVSLRGPGAASQGSAKHSYYLRSMERRQSVHMKCLEETPMFLAD